MRHVAHAVMLERERAGEQAARHAQREVRGAARSVAATPSAVVAR